LGPEGRGGGEKLSRSEKRLRTKGGKGKKEARQSDYWGKRVIAKGTHPRKLSNRGGKDSEIGEDLGVIELGQKKSGVKKGGIFSFFTGGGSSEGRTFNGRQKGGEERRVLGKIQEKGDLQQRSHRAERVLGSRNPGRKTLQGTIEEVSGEKVRSVPNCLKGEKRL